MWTRMTRRAVLAGAPAAMAVLNMPRRPREPGAADEVFPAAEPALALAMVGASHADAERVGELLKQSPRLANAAWDWGFGDWETALGAASHTGRRDIAALLIDHGARPDLFTMAMLGMLDAVKAAVEARPGLQRVKGPHGLTLMQHARAGGTGSAAVVDYLAGLGDADERYVNLPLDEGWRRVYAGAYRCDDGRTLVIAEHEQRLRVEIRRAIGTARNNLFHQGEHCFHPAGAPEVRIEFMVEGERARGLAIGPWPALRAMRDDG